MRSPSNMQTDAAFIKQIGCTSKMRAVFKNDKIIVKTGLACCPDPHAAVQLHYMLKIDTLIFAQGLIKD